MEYIDDNYDDDFDFWKHNRSRSLPRNLEQSENVYDRKDYRAFTRDTGGQR